MFKYALYLGMDDVRLFYYFIQSERNPEEDPVLLRLTGGPGCSPFSGLVYEIGSLSFDFDGYRGGLPTLLYKPTAWTKVARKSCRGEYNSPLNAQCANAVKAIYDVMLQD